ncbi:MAG: type II toxin-antitoxin system Phd/YefM family antitoxin [Chloroflexota bacterium]|nr:MAG: type II toxin-antitoxin system Phd/YefM family antitoxin [Chloroflexota bacterium]
MDMAEEDRETIVITRHGKPSAVMLAAEEWESMEATLHLLRSPRNAARLFEAMAQIERGEGVEMTIDELRRRVELDE